MEKPISIGMVGIGQFGKGFIPIFRDHPLVDRVALCDLDSQKLHVASKKYQIGETYPSLDKICEIDLDALVIITQPWLHAPQAIQAMESGKHVYSAVPIISPESGKGDDIVGWIDKLVETCKKTGMKYMLGETSFYRPEVQHAIQKNEKGEFGDIVLIEAEYLHDTLRPGCNLIDVMMARTGLDEAGVYVRGGGIPMHYVTHSASVPIAITGARATEISCFGYKMPNDRYYREDSVTGNLFSNEIATFRMSDGSVGRVIEGRRVGHPGREALYRVIGTKASLEVNLKGAIWTGFRKYDVIKVDTREKLPGPLHKYRNTGHGGSHPRLVHEFVSAISEDRQPKINAWQAARYVAIGIAAHESALQGGKLVKVPDWGDGPE